MAVGKGSIKRATAANSKAAAGKSITGEKSAAEAKGKAEVKTTLEVKALPEINIAAGAILTEIPVREISDVPEKWAGRRRNAGSIAGLAASLKKLGMIEPVILRKTGENTFQILSGSRRFRAVLELGWDTVTARVLDGLTDEEAEEIYKDLHGITEKENIHEAKFRIITSMSDDMPDYLL